MTAIVLRKELHDFIDTIPDQVLPEMKSYITSLYDENYWNPVLEPANQEEIAQIDESLEGFRSNPASFRPWSIIRNETPKK